MQNDASIRGYLCRSRIHPPLQVLIHPRRRLCHVPIRSWSPYSISDCLLFSAWPVYRGTTHDGLLVPNAANVRNTDKQESIANDVWCSNSLLLHGHVDLLELGSL